MIYAVKMIMSFIKDNPGLYDLRKLNVELQLTRLRQKMNASISSRLLDFERFSGLTIQTPDYAIHYRVPPIRRMGLKILGKRW